MTVKVFIRCSFIFENFGVDNGSKPFNTSPTQSTAISFMWGNANNIPSIASTARNTAISGSRLIRFDPDYKQLSSRRQRCDIAWIVSALQNTHNMHTKMKQRLPAFGEDPFSTEQNFLDLI